MTITDVLLAIFGALSVGAGILVVTTAHVVRAGLWLVVALSGVAGCFLVLTAEFVAWVQLLIYVGAVLVLLLFATMMTRAPIGKRYDLDRRRWPAALIAIGAFGALVALLINEFGTRKVSLADTDAGTAQRMGEVIFSDWVLAFEVLSVLLLAALIGAIAISRQSTPDSQSSSDRS